MTTLLSNTQDAGANVTDDSIDSPSTRTEEEEAKQPNSNLNTPITVAVTGASGFIASHCIKQLLEKGYNVRGTVRGDPSSDRYKWLYDISSKINVPNKVKLYQANLLETGSFTECFQDCDYIFHIASPFIVNVEDPMKDLVEPAKNGTLNVLNCALNVSSSNKRLKRIVLTSSVAAINGDPDPNKLYTENDWNDTDNLNHMPYSYSKTEAERTAWNWMDTNNTRVSFDLVSINPSLVLGRHLNDGLKTLNESNLILTRVIKGDFPVRINVAFTVADVRDVAAAHIFLIEGKAKSSATGRHLCCNEYMTLSMMMDVCDEYCAQRGIKTSIPCCRCDCNWCWCFMMCFACCFDKSEADYLRGNLNKGTHYSNNKLREMGFAFRDNNSTFVYILDYLIEAGFIGQ